MWSDMNSQDSIVRLIELHGYAVTFARSLGFITFDALDMATGEHYRVKADSEYEVDLLYNKRSLALT